MWTGSLELPKNIKIEYKFVIKYNNNILWEDGLNRVLYIEKNHIFINVAWNF